MEVVKAFNTELSSLYETRPPISKAKMTAVTRSGIKAIKFYKHVVQSVEKFIQKCKPEYKVPGLYVIDSIVRQSRHQFTAEKDVFAPRFARNIQQTFLHLFNCPQEDKGKIVRVLNLWQKNQVFTPDVIQPLLDMASLANKDQLVVPANSNGVQVPPSSTQPRTPTAKPSPAKDPSWLTPSMELNKSTAQPVPTPNVASKLQSSSAAMDPNIMQQLQNLQNLLLDKQLEANNLQNKKEDTVKFDKKLLDFDYEDDDDEPPSPQPSQSAPPLPSIDSLQTILSNPEVLRQLQTLQQQMSSRQQQAEMEDKMRRLQEMRHQEEEFDKHLAQTLPNLPFASECDFKPSSSVNVSEISPGTLAATSQQSQSLGHPDPVAAVNFGSSLTAPPAPFGSITDSDERQGTDFDERNRGPLPGASAITTINLGGDESPWENSKHANTTQNSGDGAIEIIDLIRTDSPVKSPTRSSRRRRSPSPRRSSRRTKSRSRSRSRRRRSRTRSRSRSRSRSKSREDKERERERRRRGLPPLKKNHVAVCSTTLWIGHLSKLVQQEELSDTFGEFGDIVSINLIPPRGCAFICMNRRQDAGKALQQLRHFKLQGKAITIAWAPGKGMKDREWKDYWEVEHGVSYIPWDKISVDSDLDLLEDGGVIDEESLPEFLKTRRTTMKHDYAAQLQQQQQQQMMLKAAEEKQEMLAKEANKVRAEMNVSSNVPPPNTAAGVPPAFIPLPDNMGGGTAGPPTAQPPPGMPPPMGLLPQFALPPRLLGPMGHMGHLGMGNVPLGVPPPLMMPPPPQQMVGRLPPPFNPPPQMSLMPPPTLTSADNLDKSKLTQIPPPPTPDGFPDLSSMVNPFGIPLPLPNFGNPNLLAQTQPPVVQPTINKISTEMEVVKDIKHEVKDIKPPPINMSVTSIPLAAVLKEINQSESNQIKLERGTLSGIGGAQSPSMIPTASNASGGSGGGGGGGGGNGSNSGSVTLNRKDCDWRENSPVRRRGGSGDNRSEREEKRRRRDSPPASSRRDDRRSGGPDDRRSGSGVGGNDDRRNDDRRGSGGDRRGSSSRWQQSRQNKWQDDKDRHDNRRSESPYRDTYSGGGQRQDKDERPSLLPLPHPDNFHPGGGPPHHEQQSQHFKPPLLDQFPQGLLKTPSSHHEHYQMQHEHHPPGGMNKPPLHHDQHYPGPPHDQQYPPGHMPPPHFRQHDQHYDENMGYGGNVRYPESERDEMMGSHQNSEFPPSRGYFNRGHGRMPPPRSPRPLLRTPNGPMFGPRGPPMGGPPGPPMPMNMRGHRPGPPGNRMEGPGFMPPRGFPPPGIRGRGGGGRFPPGASGARDEWEGPPRRRGWEEYPQNHPSGHLGPPGHMGPPGGPPPGGHLGPPQMHGPPSGGHPGQQMQQHPGPLMHSGPKSLLGCPPIGGGGPPPQLSLLGSPSHLRMTSPTNLERRKSRWSSASENKEVESEDIGEQQQELVKKDSVESCMITETVSGDKIEENISNVLNEFKIDPQTEQVQEKQFVSSEPSSFEYEENKYDTETVFDSNSENPPSLSFTSPSSSFNKEVSNLQDEPVETLTADITTTYEDEPSTFAAATEQKASSSSFIEEVSFSSMNNSMNIDVNNTITHITTIPTNNNNNNNNNMNLRRSSIDNFQQSQSDDNVHNLYDDESLPITYESPDTVQPIIKSFDKEIDNTINPQETDCAHIEITTKNIEETTTSSKEIKHDSPIFDIGEENNQ